MAADGPGTGEMPARATFLILPTAVSVPRSWIRSTRLLEHRVRTDPLERSA